MKDIDIWSFYERFLIYFIPRFHAPCTSSKLNIQWILLCWLLLPTIKGSFYIFVGWDCSLMPGICYFFYDFLGYFFFLALTLGECVSFCPALYHFPSYFSHIFSHPAPDDKASLSLFFSMVYSIVTNTAAPIPSSFSARPHSAGT